MADSCSSLEPVDRIVGQILEGIHFAATKHKDQRRKDPEKTPYINHPIGVAYILLKEGGVYDTDVLQVRSTVFAQRNLYVPSVTVFTTHQFCVNLRYKNCIYRLSFLLKCYSIADKWWLLHFLYEKSDPSVGGNGERQRSHYMEQVPEFIFLLKNRISLVHTPLYTRVCLGLVSALRVSTSFFRRNLNSKFY